MTQPPYVPPYGRTPRDGRPMTGLLIGLVAGAAVSALVWGAGWHRIVEGPNSTTWLVAIPLAKIILAVGLIALPRTRAAGLGLLISIALGFMIFFGSCFAHLAG